VLANRVGDGLLDLHRPFALLGKILDLARLAFGAEDGIDLGLLIFEQFASLLGCDRLDRSDLGLQSLDFVCKYFCTLHFDCPLWDVWQSLNQDSGMTATENKLF
jgi:hypothetical protein